MSHPELVDGDDEEEFILREPIWSAIEKNSLVEEEKLEIKAIIGSSLVEETLDLHEEAKSLLDIWRSYKEDTENLEKVKLRDPPNVRENLVKQIEMFVKLFKERSKGNRDISKVLTPQQRSVVKFISENPIDHHLNKRPTSAASSSDGRQTPLRPTSSSGRSSSCSSRMSDFLTIDQKQKDLNELERLGGIIRDELEQERIELQNDISFLQQCLMDESTHRQSVISANQEPSLKDLQDIGLKLEKELLNKDHLSTDSYTVKQASERKPQQRDKKPMSQPTSSVMKRVIPSPPSSAPTSKPRSHAAHRKQVIAKTFSYPSESAGAGTIKLKERDVLVGKAGPCLPVGCSANTVRTSNVTQVSGPCVNSIVGSKSKKLRDMVLECRDNR